MNYKNLLIIISFIFLTECKQVVLNNEINLNSQVKYKNSGFALIYTDDLKKKKKITKKIDNRTLIIFHKSLKRN